MLGEFTVLTSDPEFGPLAGLCNADLLRLWTRPNALPHGRRSSTSRSPYGRVRHPLVGHTITITDESTQHGLLKSLVASGRAPLADRFTATLFLTGVSTTTGWQVLSSRGHPRAAASSWAPAVPGTGWSA